MLETRPRKSIVNLLRTETLAKQPYPGEFGVYPGLGNLTLDEQLFDRTPLASLIATDQ
jgi:iron complex transport system substrate-binding protein